MAVLTLLVGVHGELRMRGVLSVLCVLCMLCVRRVLQHGVLRLARAAPGLRVEQAAQVHLVHACTDGR